MKPIRIALTKGRLENKTIELLERLGYDCTNARKKGRKLIMPIGNGEIEVVLAVSPLVSPYTGIRVCSISSYRAGVKISGCSMSIFPFFSVTVPRNT